MGSWLPLLRGGDAGFFVRTLGAPATWQPGMRIATSKKRRLAGKVCFLIKYIQKHPKTMIEQSEFGSPTKFCEREREYGVVTTV